jgi:hypothetical protein
VDGVAGASSTGTTEIVVVVPPRVVVAAPAKVETNLNPAEYKVVKTIQGKTLTIMIIPKAG